MCSDSPAVGKAVISAKGAAVTEKKRKRNHTRDRQYHFPSSILPECRETRSPASQVSRDSNKVINRNRMNLTHVVSVAVIK